MTADNIDARLRGLSQLAARRRLAEDGLNALPEAKAIGLGRRLLAQFKSALIYILLFALALDFALWLHEGARQIPYDALAIGVILILNAGLGAYQEAKAEEALAGLKALAVPSIWVTCGRRLGKSFMTDADMGGCGHVSGLLVRRL
jgi:Ca2+-transporting ATPase